MKKIKVGNKYIGDDQSVFVIAEAGVNHNGDLGLAFKLIDAAVAAGADAVKFQTFKAGDVVTGFGKMADYQKRNIGKTENQLGMLKKLELPDSFYLPLIRYCRKKKVMFLSTPHGGFKAVDLLNSLKVPAFKLGSGDLTNTPLLQYTAKFGKPIILSTGMATLKEVRIAVNTIKKAGNNKIIVLHCTTNYPCPLDEVNLRAMLTMQNDLKVLVGYSDHTDGIQAPIIAVTLGACLIEKHFTLDKNMSGPDHKASLDPNELKEMVQAIRKIPLVLGSSIKQPSKSERSVLKIVRKSVVAERNIKKRETFSKQNLAIKRPGIGLSPQYWYRLLGKKAKKNYKKDELIKPNEI